MITDIRITKPGRVPFMASEQTPEIKRYQQSHSPTDMLYIFLFATVRYIKRHATNPNVLLDGNIVVYTPGETNVMIRGTRFHAIRESSFRKPILH